LAPFHAQQETIDRNVSGVHQRSYLVIFNEKAPVFGLVKEKLQSWIPSGMPELEPENVQWIYEITENFRGFSVWATPANMESVLAYDFIKYVEEDMVVRALAPFTSRPDWGQVRSDKPGARNLATVPANQYSGSTYPNAGAETTVWDWAANVTSGYRYPNDGSLSRVWIVDTGVLQTHSEFITASGARRVVVSVDYVTSGGAGTDCNGHGSHCAGSAAGRYRGIAPGAEIGNVRVLDCGGSGTNAAVINGFNYVANNQVSGKTNILSASLGGGASQASDDAINNAATKGVIPVVAAGNNNLNACNYSPARATGAITIGATTQADAIASFSNWGSCVNVFAPGVSIHSAWYTSTTTYNTISGTSMATPLTAGAIAVYASSFAVGSQPVTNSVIRSAITRTGTSGVLTGLPANTVNLLINAKWGLITE